LAVVSGRCFQF